MIITVTHITLVFVACVKSETGRGVLHLFAQTTDREPMETLWTGSTTGKTFEAASITGVYMWQLVIDSGIRMIIDTPYKTILGPTTVTEITNLGYKQCGLHYPSDDAWSGTPGWENRVPAQANLHNLHTQQWNYGYLGTRPCWIAVDIGYVIELEKMKFSGARTDSNDQYYPNQALLYYRFTNSDYAVYTENNQPKRLGPSFFTWVEQLDVILAYTILGQIFKFEFVTGTQIGFRVHFEGCRKSNHNNTAFIIVKDNSMDTPEIIDGDISTCLLVPANQVPSIILVGVEATDFNSTLRVMTSTKVVLDGQCDDPNSALTKHVFVAVPVREASNTVYGLYSKCILEAEDGGEGGGGGGEVISQIYFCECAYGVCESHRIIVQSPSCAVQICETSLL